MMDAKNLKPGEEQYEYFTHRAGLAGTRKYCQYDYRDDDGELFSCVRRTLEDCRLARNNWLDKR